MENNIVLFKSMSVFSLIKHPILKKEETLNNTHIVLLWRLQECNRMYMGENSLIQNLFE